MGFFAGGEWGSGAVITMETVPKKHRGLLSGFLQSGFNFGFVIAAIAFQFAVTVFPAEQFTEIGWRVMFFTGIIPGFIALIVRFKMVESEDWLAKSKQHKIEKSPIRKLFFSKQERKHFFFALILMAGLMFSYYSTMGFFPTFLQNYLTLEKPEVASLMIVATITSLFGTIFAGYISQIIGRMKPMYSEKLTKDEEAFLGLAKKNAVKNGVKLSAKITEFQKPGEYIVKLAQEQNFDLIVIGARGGFSQGVFLGKRF